MVFIYFWHYLNFKKYKLNFQNITETISSIIFISNSLSTLTSYNNDSFNHFRGHLPKYLFLFDTIHVVNACCVVECLLHSQVTWLSCEKRDKLDIVKGYEYTTFLQMFLKYVSQSDTTMQEYLYVLWQPFVVYNIH